jgi:hypothetical protein
VGVFSAPGPPHGCSLIFPLSKWAAMITIAATHAIENILINQPVTPPKPISRFLPCDTIFWISYILQTPDP